MTHDQISATLNKALTGVVALSEVTVMRPGPPTVQPRRHLAVAMTEIENALGRVGNALALEQAYEQQPPEVVAP